MKQTAHPKRRCLAEQANHTCRPVFDGNPLGDPVQRQRRAFPPALRGLTLSWTPSSWAGWFRKEAGRLHPKRQEQSLQGARTPWPRRPGCVHLPPRCLRGDPAEHGRKAINVAAEVVVAFSAPTGIVSRANNSMAEIKLPHRLGEKRVS